MSHLKIAAWNANGLRTQAKRLELLSLLRRHDIICISEAHAHSSKTKKLTRSLLGYSHSHTVVWSSFSNAARGVLVIARKSNSFSILSSSSDSEGRVVYLRIRLTQLNRNLKVVAIYAPAASDSARVKFFNSLKLSSSSLVVGDFNNVLDPMQDRCPPGPSSVPSRKVLSELMNQHDLVDSWRALNPSGVDFTYIKSDYSGRLDRFLVPSWLHSRVSSTSILKEKGSDHLPISISIRLNNIRQGTDRFFLNTSLLNNSSFIAGLQDFFASFLEMYPLPQDAPPLATVEWWDFFKSQLLNHFRLRSPIYARQHKRVRIGLEKQLLRLNLELLEISHSLSLKPHDQQILEAELDTRQQRDSVLAALKSFNTYKLEGVAVRTQFFHSHIAEKVPSYLAKFERHQADSRIISSFLDPNDNILSSIPDLLSHAHKFWGNLFHSPTYGPYQPPSPSAAQSFLRRPSNTPLPTALYESLGQPISSSEISNILASLPKFRSAGPDGIPYEFYAHPNIRDFILPLLFATLQASIELGSLPISLLNCDIVMLHKKGDRNQISNFRPISILNCDYRILTRLLVARLNPVAKHLVHQDQTGFVKGRLISDNGMLLTSLLEYAEWDTDFTGGLLFLDFEKAFDSVEWSWLFSTLEAFGLPPYFIHIVKMLYSSPLASVIINGHRSHSFEVGRGVRQGCPLSPLLFALAIEPLAIYIRSSSNLRGILVPYTNTRLKLSLFADDATSCISSAEDLDVLYKILSSFERASGLRLNSDKVVGLWLSPSAVPPPSLAQRCKSWVARGEVERVLGFRLGVGVHPAILHQHVLEKMRTRLQLFSQRFHTLKARSLILKMSIHSLLWYFAFVTPVTKKLLNLIDIWSYNFLWRRQGSTFDFIKTITGKVARTRLSYPKQQGGLNLQSVSVQLEALRAKWIKLFLDDSHKAAWKSVVLSRLYATTKPWLPLSPQIVLATINFIDVTKAPKAHGFPLYLAPIIKHFQSLAPRRTMPLTPFDIADQPLFHNDLIPEFIGAAPTNNAPLRPWAVIGVIQVKHIFFADGSPRPYSYFYHRLHNLANTTQSCNTNKFHHRSEAQLLRMQQSIPNSWRSALSQTEGEYLYSTTNLAQAYSVRLCPVSDLLTPISKLTPALVRTARLANLPAPLSRWETVFPSVSSIPWHLIWDSVHSPILSFTHQQFLWLLAHRAFNVHASSRMQAIARSLGLPPPSCPHCLGEETHEHLFFDCSLIQPYWRMVHRFATVFLYYVPSDWQDFRRFILLGDFMFHSVPCHTHHYDSWLILRASSLHSVWLLRCKAAYDSPTPPLLSHYVIYQKFFSQLANYANFFYYAIDRYESFTLERFSEIWVPGLFTTYSCRSIVLRRNVGLPSLKPGSVCSCSTPQSPSSNIQSSSFFLSLPSRPTRCGRCNAPPAYYPTS